MSGSDDYAVSGKAGDRYLSQVRVNSPLVINMMIPNLGFGGAERIALDLIRDWRRLERKNYKIDANLIVLSEIRTGYRIPPEHPTIKVISLAGWPVEQRFLQAALIALNSGHQIICTHLIGQTSLRELWARGIGTVPVIHNMPERWTADPRIFRSSNVPFVIAVSDAVADALRNSGCRVPIHTILHETSISVSATKATKRLEERRLYGITDDELVIGMVGKFKAHKRYCIGIEALAQLQSHIAATLIIVGPWKESPSESLDEYRKTMALAERLNVAKKVICVGGTLNVHKFYRMFDIFLNTSRCEGLSISVMEAHAHGLPCIITDVGGQAQGINPTDVLMRENATAREYSEAVLSLGKITTQISKSPSPSLLVPRLWLWLANHGMTRRHNPKNTAAFITNDLAVGSARNFLVSLLCSISPRIPSILCVLTDVCCEQSLKTLNLSSVTLFSTSQSALLDKVDTILAFIDAGNIQTVCFWNVDADLKLILVKVLRFQQIEILDVEFRSHLSSTVRSAAPFARRIAFSANDYASRVRTIIANTEEDIPSTLQLVRDAVMISNR